jgi:glycosyltransferase involved in cell wall biosynthesis
MRILFLAGYTHPSHHRKIELLANHPELSITHITFPDSGKPDGAHISEDGLHTYNTISLPVDHIGAEGDPHRFFHRSIDLLMRQIRPDIVHCEQEIESLASLQAALSKHMFARQARFVGYSWQNVNRRHRNLAVKLVARIVLLTCSHVLAANMGVEKVLRAQGYHGPVTRSPMFGVDTRFFRPSYRTRASDEYLHVGYVGRLAPEKGIDTLIKAVNKTGFVKLSIAGSGPEGSRLQALASELGLAGRVTFTGPVTYDSMPAHFSRLDVLVLPSRATPNWEEQLGRVLLEAMACKVVVVGASTGAIPEVISDCGLLFSQDNAEELANCLRELHENPKRRELLSTRGVAHAIKTYGIESLADNIATVWRSLTSQNIKHGTAT